MAKLGSAPASSAQNVEVDDTDPWKHVVVDVEGSAAFASEDEAKAYADAKGVPLEKKEKNDDGDTVTNPNLVKIGTMWAILDTSAKHAKKSEASAPTMSAAESAAQAERKAAKKAAKKAAAKREADAAAKADADAAKADADAQNAPTSGTADNQ